MVKKYRNKKADLPEAGVNITPLLDVLTVLLFFLIKSMSVNDVTLDPPKGIRLPASEVQAKAEDAVRIALSSEQLLVNNKVMLVLRNGKFKAADVGPDKRTLLPLKAFLDKQIEKKHALFKGVGDLSKLPPDKVIIQADKDLKFGSVKYMLHTIAASGYTDYQFVVMPNN